MAGTGDIAMSSNFELSSQRPLDARITVADVTARDAIATVKRYDSLETYAEDTKISYRLVLGTVDTDLSNNNNWVNVTFIVGTTNVSDLVNDANYIAIGDNISDLVNDSNYVAVGDNISDLVNDSNYAVVGANVSIFVNDVGYLTSIPSNVMVEGENVSLLTNDAGYLTSTLQATESALGMAELATQTETNTGTDDLRIVTPLKLRTTTFVPSQIPEATETAIGGVEKATNGEANAGTADKYIDAELLQTSSVDISDTTTWTSIGLINGWTGTLLTRIDRYGYTELYGAVDPQLATDTTAFTVPLFQRPNYNFGGDMYRTDTPGDLSGRVIVTALGIGNLYGTTSGFNSTWTFHIRVPNVEPS